MANTQGGTSVFAMTGTYRRADEGDYLFPITIRSHMKSKERQ